MATDPRAMRAVERIEQALLKLEAASLRQPIKADDGELIRVKEAHQLLQGKVEAAIGQIDHLLASRGKR